MDQTNNSQPPELVALHEMQAGQYGDTYVLLSERNEARTKDDRPYFRVTFRDAQRSANAMLWHDHALFEDCRSSWKVGTFYKLRCRYTEHPKHGSQIEIDRLRPVNETDREAGFDEDDYYASSRYDRDEMFEALLGIAKEHITDEPLQRLVVEMLTENGPQIQRHAAAMRNHHAFNGGYLEHTLSVTRNAVFFADRYIEYYQQMQPPLSKSLVVAGAILHDIGKLEELEFRPEGWVYTASGRLVGHILIGRDMVRKKAEDIPELDAETLLRLEHIIISHQNLPEWGSPIAPHTPEAMLVHFADDLDAKFHELAVQLEANWPAGQEFTDRKNPLRRSIFIGLDPGGQSSVNSEQ